MINPKVPSIPWVHSVHDRQLKDHRIHGKAQRGVRTSGLDISTSVLRNIQSSVETRPSFRIYRYPATTRLRFSFRIRLMAASVSLSTCGGFLKWATFKLRGRGRFACRVAVCIAFGEWVAAHTAASKRDGRQAARTAAVVCQPDWQTHLGQPQIHHPQGLVGLNGCQERLQDEGVSAATVSRQTGRGVLPMWEDAAHGGERVAGR